jgi:hypothetical protein
MYLGLLMIRVAKVMLSKITESSHLIIMEVFQM